MSGHRTLAPEVETLVTGEPTPGPGPDCALPTRIGRYEIRRVLGTGGMGIIYEGYDPELDRELAVKLVRPRGGGGSRAARQHQRLLREARALAALSHPNVVTIYDVGETDDDVYLVMERIEGNTVKEWIRDEHPRWPAIAKMLHAAGCGLQAAHATGIVHRDFKPDNIMITPEGDVRVLDFGLAVEAGDGDTSTRSLDLERPSQLDETASLLGTPGYISPEQVARKPVGPSADVFSFCVTAHELLLGELPFAGDTSAQLLAAASLGELRPVPAGLRVPSHLVRAIRQGLHPSPENRPSLDELLDALDGATGRRGRWLLIVPAAVAVAGVAALGLGVAPNPACEDVRTRGDAVWNVARREALGQTLMETELPYAAATWRGASRTIDLRTRAWTTATEALCDGRTRYSPPDADRLSCLSSWLAELDAVLTILEAGEPAFVEHAPATVEGLFPVQWCESSHRSGPRHSEALRAELARNLHRATALVRADAFDEGGALLEEVLARSESGSALHIRATIAHAGLLAISDPSRAATQLEAAYWEASSGGRDQLAARAAVSLASLLGHLLKRPDEAMKWERHTQAVLARVTLAEADAAHVGYHRAILDLSLGRPESAASRARAARTAFGEQGMPFLQTLAMSFEVRALRQLGQTDEARRVAEQTVDFATEQFGAQHSHAVAARGLLDAIDTPG